MTQTKTGVSQRVLLVDDDDLTLELTTLQLVKKGFEVVAAPSVTAALKFIVTETFDVLVTDLNMPNAADGFTVVTAMRHSHPQALILLVSGNPDVDRAMATIALEPDEILVKPLECQNLPELIREKMLSRKPAPRVDKERAGVVLNRCQPAILEEWLTRAKRSELIHVNLPDNERTGHLPEILDEIAARLAKNHPVFLEENALISSAAAKHGRMRSLQGYTAAMLVHESRILQVTLFETLQKNLSNLDFSLLLPDVMRIADEVNSQLAQAMVSFTKSRFDRFRKTGESQLARMAAVKSPYRSLTPSTCLRCPAFLGPHTQLLEWLLRQRWMSPARGICNTHKPQRSYGSWLRTKATSTALQQEVPRSAADRRSRAVQKTDRVG